MANPVPIVEPELIADKWYLTNFSGYSQVGYSGCEDPSPVGFDSPALGAALQIRLDQFIPCDPDFPIFETSPIRATRINSITGPFDDNPV